MQDGVAHDFDDAVVADGRAVAKRVDAAAGLHGREELGGGDHLGGAGGERFLVVG